MTEQARQIPLGVQLRDDATLDNFLFMDDSRVIEGLLRSDVSAGEQFIYLYGQPGSGCSHLLQAACHLLPPGQAQYLPLGQVSTMPAADLFESLERLPLLCLDDLDAVMGCEDWEQALFHLCNRVRDGGGRLLFAARQAPRQLPCGLPDLQSRLSWGPVLQLPPPDDAHKQAILQFRAARRGLSLSDEVCRYVLSRAGRSMSELMQLLEQLDRASLVHQRQLSIPFVKSSLGW